MAVEQDVSRLQRRQAVRVENMAVGGVDAETVNAQQGVVRHQGKIQHHLVHFRVAVSPDAQDVILPRVQHGNDLLGGIAVGQIVARTVIQNVSQQEKPVRLLPVISFQQFAAVQGGTVDIRSNQQFQRSSLPCKIDLPR